jgi:hypothetical protein
MDNEIKVGDLAYVYRDCKYCGNDDDLGQIIKVTGFKKSFLWVTCCNTMDTSTLATYEGQQDAGKYMWGLKKIPPLEDLEGLKSQEDKPIEVT